jgi:hypothetical protein
MKKTGWKDIVEIIGITAIVTSLVVLAIEVNQNTQTLRAEAIQRSTEIARQQIMMYAQSEDIVRILMEDDLSKLTDVERRRAFYINRSMMVGMQGLFRQWRMGVLPDEDWEFWVKIICVNADNEPFEELWTPETLIPSFVEYVREICISDVKL